MIFSLHEHKASSLRDFYASWSSGNAFVSGAGGLRFKSRAGQIGHSVADGSPSLRYFSERSCVARRNDAEIGPVNLLQASAYYSEHNERLNLKIYRLLLLSVLHLCNLEKHKISQLEFFVTKMQLRLTTIGVYFITALLSASFTLCRCLQKKLT